MRQRFETEMRAVGQLAHPNIVTAHNAREVDELAVLVTEFIDGLDVGQILRRAGRLSVANACEIAKQIAVALQYVHEQGLVHRDIKPSNVMIGKAGNVKLLDLGLSRLQLGDGERVEMTATGQAMGTADYVAPEQVNDSRHVDIRADIYALGCTLFRMLCGRTPFDDEQYPTAFAKMTAHVSSAPPSLDMLVPEVPAELAKLVQRMMSKSAADRPQTPAEVVELFAKFAQGADLQQVVAQSARRWRSRQPAAAQADSCVPPDSAVAGSQPLLHRRVPLLVALAAGLLGALLGFALGVIITIKHPDGTQTQVETPQGSIAKVSPDGNVEIELAAGKKKAIGSSQVEITLPDNVMTVQQLVQKGANLSASDNPVTVRFFVQQVDRHFDELRTGKLEFPWFLRYDAGNEQEFRIELSASVAEELKRRGVTDRWVALRDKWIDVTGSVHCAIMRPADSPVIVCYYIEVTSLDQIAFPLLVSRSGEPAFDEIARAGASTLDRPLLTQPRPTRFPPNAPEIRYRARIRRN